MKIFGGVTALGGKLTTATGDAFIKRWTDKLRNSKVLSWMGMCRPK